MLEVAGLNAAYGQAQILFDVALTTEPGEVVVLLGRNGAGKSTTLKSLIGLVRPTSGEVRFNGERIDRMEPFQIARLGLGYVPEDRRIFADLSVMENLEVGRQAPRKDSAQWTPERLFELFPNLGRMKDRRGGRMSGGEQQMLTIGRALMTNPDLLILDEATEGLAPLIREEIWQCLSRLREAGQTILVVDKYVERLIALADRHTILERGRVAWHGTSAELDADHGLWHRYLGV